MTSKTVTYDSVGSMSHDKMGKKMTNVSGSNMLMASLGKKAKKGKFKKAGMMGMKHA